MNEPKGDTYEDAQTAHGSGLLPVHSYLFVVLECDRPMSGGARYRLTDVDEVIVGRGAKRRAVRETVGGVRRLTMSLPGRSMSSIHARLVRTSEGWRLEDLHSTNGSFVNGERVERALIRDGQVFDLGHTVLMLREALPTPPGTADLDTSDADGEPPGLATLVPAASSRVASLLRIASLSLPVLLLGETGTGKEVLARNVHEASGRSGPLVAVNCGALAANLVESQLFGHVKGAFSGAVRDELGAIRSAHEGTLLLDEIGDLPRAAQPALLRFLQEGEVNPIGNARPVRVNVRVVAATHQPMADLVAKGQFRADLFARLNGFTHNLPSLRLRREDMGLLVASILAKARASLGTTLSPSLGRFLLTHDWPGNIRQLELALLRGLALTDEGPMTVRNLFADAAPEGTSANGVEPAQARVPRHLSDADAKICNELTSLLQEHRGNVASVARAMGKARMQIHRWMHRFGMDVDTYRR